jgi:hypothetical protein
MDGGEMLKIFAACVLLFLAALVVCAAVAGLVIYVLLPVAGAVPWAVVGYTYVAVCALAFVEGCRRLVKEGTQ